MFLNLLNRFHVASRASAFEAWAPTRRTHLLHVGVALFLGFISFTSTSTPREAPAVIATALALVCLPLTSFLPVAGAITSFIVTWGAQVVPYDVGAIAPSVCWGRGRDSPDSRSVSLCGVLILLRSAAARII